MADAPDPKVQTFLAIARELARDTTTPQDIAEALLQVFQYIEKRYKDAETLVEEATGEAKRGDDDLLDKVRGLIKATKQEATDEDKRIEKLVDGIIAWKNEQKDLPDDVAEALETGDENTTAIGKLRTELEKIELTPGPPGKRGKIPDHEWEDTSIRFQKPDGTWGKWVDLRGEPGGGGFSFFGGGRPEGLVIHRITSNGTSGPATLSPDGTLNIPQYTGGGSGSTLTIVDPTSGAVNDANRAFVFASKPFLIVVNQRTYRENAGWTWNAGTSTATLSATDPGPVGTGGDIYGIIQA